MEAVDIPFGSGDTTQTFPDRRAVVRGPGNGRRAWRRRIAGTERFRGPTLIEPAERLARVGRRAHRSSRRSSTTSSTPCCGTTRTAGGSTASGRRLAAPASGWSWTDLAETLDDLPADGARRVLPRRARRAPDRARSVERGGTLTAQTSPRTESSSRRPVRVGYRGHELVSNPPPSSGGVLIAYALRLLDRLGPGGAAGKRRRDRPARRDRAGGGACARGERSRPICSAAGSHRACSPTTSVDAQPRRSVGRSARARPPEPAGPAVDDPHQRRRHARERGIALLVDRMRLRGDRPGHGHPAEQHARRARPEPVREGGGPGTPPDQHDGTDVVLLRNGRPRLVVGSAGSERLRGAIVQTIVNVVDHGLRASTRRSTRPRVHLDGEDAPPRGRNATGSGGSLSRSADTRLVRWPGRQRNLYFGGVSAVGRRRRRRARGRRRPEARRCRRGRRVIVSRAAGRAARRACARRARPGRRRGAGGLADRRRMANGGRSREERRYLRARLRLASRRRLRGRAEDGIVGRLSIARDAHPASAHVADLGLMVARPCAAPE